MIGEVALALVALIGAGLFLKSFEHAWQVDPGFDPRHVLLAQFDLTARGSTQAQGLDFARRLRERLESTPGIQAVSYADSAPLGFDSGSWREVQVEGYVPGFGESTKVYRNAVSPGYFDLMKIPLVDGRDFTAHDGAGSPRVTIVNETST